MTLRYHHEFLTKSFAQVATGVAFQGGGHRWGVGVYNGFSIIVVKLPSTMKLPIIEGV